MAGRRIEVEIVGDTKSLTAALGMAGAETEAFGKKAEGMAAATETSTGRAGKSFSGFSGTTTKLALGVGAGLVGIAAKSISMAGDFEKSMNTLKAVSGATGSSFDALRQQAIALGADTKLPGTSAKDAAEAMTELSKAGIKTTDIMKATRPVLLLSAAAEMSNADAAELAANAMNSFGVKSKDMTKVVDMLANTANASSVEITDVADAMKMAGAVFSAMQGPTLGAKGAMKELSIAIGQLGNAGIKGSDAGTSLKQTLLQLAAPSLKAKNMMRDLYIATGGGAQAMDLFQTSVHGVTKKIRDEAENALEKLRGGIKGGGDIAYDAAGKMRPLHEIIRLVTDATKNMTAEQRDGTIASIFGADATRSVVSLMHQGVDGYNKMADAVGKSGSAQELANAKMKGFKGSMDAFKSTLETLAITFGSDLLPITTKFMQVLAQAFGQFSEHKTTVKVFVALLATFAATILTVNLAFKVYAMAQKLAAAATAVMTAAQWALNAAMDANPLMLIVIGLVALGAAIVIAYKKSETFRDIVNKMWDVIKEGVRVVVDFGKKFVAAFEAILGWVKSNWKTIAIIISGPFAPLVALATNAFGIRDKLTDALDSIIDWVKSHWKTIATVIAGPFAPLVALATNAFGIRDKLTNAFEDIISWVKAHWKEIATLLSGPFAPIVALATGAFGIRDALEGALTKMVSAVKTSGEKIGSAISDGVLGPISKLASSVGGYIADVGKAITGKFSDAAKWGEGLGEHVKDGVVDGLKGIGSGAWDIVNNVGEVIAGKAGAIKNWGENVGSWIKGAVGPALTGIGNAAWDVINNIGSVIAGKAGAVKEWGSNIGDWIKGAVGGGLAGIGGKAWDVINNIGATITDKLGTIKGWGDHIATALENGLKEGMHLGVAIASGFEKAYDTVHDAIGTLKKHIVRWLRDAFDWFSPSGLFEELGQDMMRGLAKGILGKFQHPMDALKWIFKMVGKAFPDNPLGWLQNQAGEAFGLVSSAAHAAAGAIGSAAGGASVGPIPPGGGGGGGATGGGGSGTVGHILGWIGQNINRWPYTWGGGHNSSFAPSRSIGRSPGGNWYPGIGYDCSGFVSAALHAGGLLGSPLGSGSMGGISGGVPGRNSSLSVAYNRDHTFIHAGGYNYGTGWGPNGGAGIDSRGFPSTAAGHSVSWVYWPGVTGRSLSAEEPMPDMSMFTPRDTFGGYDGGIAPDLVGALGGGNVGGFWKGTKSAPGGWAWVGEKGPELMYVPRGAQVVPNDRLPGGGGGGSSAAGPTVVVNLNGPLMGSTVPEVAQTIRRELVRHGSRNGSVGLS